MSEHGPKGDVPVPAYRDWSSFPDGFEAAWAGAGRNAGEFCLGSEDGRLMFVPHDGNRTLVRPFGPLDSEPVNAVAFIGSTYAISTRREIVFLTVPPSGPEAQRSIFPAGAHGVIATADKSFVAPLGPSGLMSTRPTTSDLQAITFGHIYKRPLNYYKAVSVVSRSAPEVIVCAARKDGVVAAPFTSDGLRSARVMTLPGLDVVDVCTLGPDLETPAAVALGQDGTLVLFRDVLHDTVPTTIQYEGIEGTGYRVMVIRGTVIVLTSQGLYFLPAFAKRFLQGEPMNVPIQMRERRIEAVDANTADDRWLLIVESDRVIRLDVPQFLATANSIEAGAQQVGLQGTPVTQLWEITEGLSLTTEPGELIAA